MPGLKTIQEVLFSVGDMDKAIAFFCTYGGWDIIGRYHTDRDVLDAWELPESTSGEEVLIRAVNHPTGWIRLIQFHGVTKGYCRSSQKPWDIGGIMDINLRVHDVQSTFDHLRNNGWHGVSDPLFQEMGPFALYDVLMNGFDDTIVAFTHRVKPPLQLPVGLNIPSHIYNSSITVSNLAEAQAFYKNKLGFTLLNEYGVKKDKPQENMFGMPFNLANKIDVQANIFSLDGERDVIFQIVEYVGLTGKDHRKTAKVPNRGLALYRCAVDGIDGYYNSVKTNGVDIMTELSEVKIEPFGQVKRFSVVSPNAVIWEFYEI